MNVQTIKKVNIVLSLILLGVFIAYWNKPEVTFRNQADGFAYYLPLRSYVYDHDFDFTNENKAFENTYNALPYAWKEKTKQNLPVYHYSIGSSILWSPFILLEADHSNNTFRIPLYEEIPHIILGFSNHDLHTIIFASQFYGILALIFGFLFLLKLDTSSPITAALSVAISALSLPFLYYFRYQPLMSHVLSACVVSLFLYGWILQYYKNSWYRYLYLGLLLGLVALVRWQDAVVGLAFFIEVLSNFFKLSKTQKIKILFNCGIFFLGFLLTFIPQIVFWKEVYGSYFLIPQGATFFSLNAEYFFNFLFSFRHGLFTWSPIVLASLSGLIAVLLIKNKSKKSKSSKIQITGLLLVTFVSIFINGSLKDWHGSDSFGARRIVSLFPIFSAGIYALLLLSKSYMKIVLIFVFICISLYTILFSDLFYLQKIDHYSEVSPSNVLFLIKTQYFSK